MMEVYSGIERPHLIRDGTRSTNIIDKVTCLWLLSSYIAVSFGVVKVRYGTPIEDHILWCKLRIQDPERRGGSLLI